MTPPTRLPTAQRRRQIAMAALRIISTQGVSRMTTVALAHEVGISDGAIFRHFKDKAEIVIAAIDLFEANLEETFPSPEGDPLDRLGSFVVQRLTLLRKNPEILQLAFSDRLAEAAGEEGAARVAALVGRSVALIHDCLTEAQSLNQITRDTQAGILTWMVIGVVRGASTTGPQFVSGADRLPEKSPKDIWAALKNFLLSTAPEQPS